MYLPFGSLFQQGVSPPWSHADAGCVYALLFDDGEKLAGDLGEAHQKDIVKEHAPYESAKFYKAQQNSKECKVGK